MRKFVAYPVPAVAGVKPVTLGDDAIGHAISTGLPQPDNDVQTLNPIRGDFTVRIDRGNVTNTLVWTVDRDHGSEKAALDFLRDHGQAVLQLGICNVEDSGKNINTRWWTNAKIKPQCVRHDGQSTVFQYTMVAGKIVTKL